MSGIPLDTMLFTKVNAEYAVEVSAFFKNGGAASQVKFLFWYSITSIKRLWMKRTSETISNTRGGLTIQ